MIRRENGVIFRKDVGPSTHTLVAIVTRDTGFDPGSVGFAEYATNPDVFTAYVKASVEHVNASGSRIHMLEQAVTPDTRFGYCAKVYSKGEDHGSDFAPRVLIQEDWGYTCLHPDSASVIIQVVFSERSLPGENDPALEKVREMFFNGFRFTSASTPTRGDSNEDMANPVSGVAEAKSQGAAPPATLDSAAGALSSAAVPAVVFVVKSSLRDAVRKAAEQYQPPLDFSLEGDLKANRSGYTIQLTFSSVVDRSGQTRNRDGAMAGGPLTLLLGTITPWTCPTTHTLNAVVTDPNGKRLGSYQLEEKEKRVGTMLLCGDVEDPGNSIIAKLVSELLQKIAADKLLS
jgi:hypothetical protein